VLVRTREKTVGGRERRKKGKAEEGKGRRRERRKKGKAEEGRKTHRAEATDHLRVC